MDCLDSRAFTPLFFAAEAGHLEMIHFLLDEGADIEAKANDGATPLISTARTDQPASLEALR